MTLRTKWDYYSEETQYVFGDNPDNLGWGKLANAFDSYAYHLEAWDVQLFPRSFLDRSGRRKHP